MDFLKRNKHNPWFWAFVILATLLFFAMPLMSRDAGNSGDEDRFQIPQGYNVLNYYKTNHQDTTCLNFEGNVQFYGCSFDVVTAWVNQTFHINDISTSRHMANAFLGWVAVLFVGLIAWRIGGWRAGVMALLLMFFSPRFLGHSFNNPKDIPLATGVIMSIYYIMMFFRQASNPDRKMPRISTMVMLLISFALAVSVRIGAFIIVGYMGLWGILWMISQTSNRRQLQSSKVKGRPNPTKRGFMESVDWGRTFKMAGLALLICLLGFFAGILLWPYAMQAPVKNSIAAYHAMSEFAIAIRQLYEGQMVMSDALPWYYTPKFILTTIPIAVIIGWILFPCFGAFRKGKRLESFMLYFCFLFPVFWIVYTHANVYGGWRHSLFAYPPMVATAALGFNAVAERITKHFARKDDSATDSADTSIPAPCTKKARIPLALCYTAFLALLLPPALHTLRNHPYEYVYFNELIGGTHNAFGKYEMDYYYHSTHEATEWVIANAKPSPLQNEKKIIVGAWHPNSVQYFLRNDTARFRHQFVRWAERGNADWDYAVFSLTGIPPEYLLNSKVFPPKGTVHEIKVDGKDIAIVLKREDKNDLYGYQCLTANKPDSALMFLSKALAYDPYNAAALINMAQLYLMRNKPDSALTLCNRIFEFDPDNATANRFAVLSYMNTNNLQGAERCLNKLIRLNQIDNQMAQCYVNIQRANGFDEQTAVFSLYSEMIKSLEDQGKTKEAQQLKSQLGWK